MSSVLHVEKARFICSAVSSKGYPKLYDTSGNHLPEIAFVGRSNVGKSSLINHLLRLRHKGLARTSSTPGKTREINFFSIDDGLAFVDLPGYGYAKVSKKQKEQWSVFIQEYLEDAHNLKLILFLFDCRRMPNEDDLMLMDWFEMHGLDTELILTKVDKLTNNELQAQLKKILHAFGKENLHTIPYSVTKNKGRQELLAAINSKNIAKKLK
ncbi:MAG: ribosome biogenesis GTP-binding protein YihA/YsxC [Chlamydiales bacterium]